MGRGRAKAKQTKVARRLKYSGPDTDLQALESELKGSDDLDVSSVDIEVDDDPYADDPYAKYTEDYDYPDEDD